MKLRDRANRVKAHIVATETESSPAEIARIVHAEFPLLTNDEKLLLHDAVLTGICGMGPLEHLSKKLGVTDILVNGPSDVWYADSAGLHPCEVEWESESELREFASHLANQSNRRLDEAQPFLEVQLKNGMRVHVIIPPLSPKGTCISIRIPQAQLHTLADLHLAGMFNEETFSVLRQIIDSGISFMICGGTGSGKTTLLAALLAEVSSSQRVIIIEDTSELQVSHPHVVSLQARNANTEGAGEVSLRELVRQALRMRPDRLILGEVRGVEIVDLVNALNTGHAGGCATIHANSAKDVPSRIISLGLLAGVPTLAIQQLFATAIQLIVELVQLPDGRRQVARIQLVEQIDSSVRVLPAFDWQSQGHDAVGLSKFRELIQARLQ